MSNQKSIPLGSFPEPLQNRRAQLEPFEWYRTQRASEGVRYDERRQCYDVFDYETVERVLSDHETFSSDPLSHPDNTPENTSSVVRSMIYQDPPRHTELRSTVEDYFTPGSVAELAPDVEQLANELLDDAVDGQSGEFDLVKTFAYPLPITVVADMLGVPPADRDRFREWSMQLVASTGMDGGDSDRAEEKLAIYADLEAYFEELLAARQADPRDDLLSRFVATDELSVEDVFGFCFLLLIAGNVTTTSLIASAVWCLGDRNLLSELGDDRKALDLAIEEVLRYRSPIQAMQRWTIEPTTIGGEKIPENSSVVAWIGAANRDETVFDDPETFVPNRRPNRHIAFGHGIHTCLGASLARLEARAAIDALVDRFDSLDPVTEDLPPSGSMMVYGPRSLPVRYEVGD